MTFWICTTCAVEHAERAEVCAICSDDRQYVPGSGQEWTTLAEMTQSGYRAELRELEPELWGLTSSPEAGIGQTSKLLRTPQGALLFDPLGFLDERIVGEVRALGPVRAIVASHPHMFGVQVEWSRALGGVPVLVAEADADWVARPDPAIETWSGAREILPGVTLSQPGGHFPGSTVVHWRQGADGRGAVLAGDTVFANPDGQTVSFMRSYPNHIPLSAQVAERIAAHLEVFEFDRLYGNFDHVVARDARAAVRRSADRHIAWIRGDFDHLT